MGTSQRHETGFQALMDAAEEIQDALSSQWFGASTSSQFSSFRKWCMVYRNANHSGMTDLRVGMLLDEINLVKPGLVY